MEFGAQGEEKGSVMTARDYYITARHEIDPLYTNKSQQRLYLKCFLITWCNCSEEKTNEGCVYSTVGLVADGNLWQQPGNGELWPTGITCSLSSYNLLSDPGLRVYSFLTCRFLAKHLKHPPWFQAGGEEEGVADRIWLRPAAAVPAGFYWKKTLKTDRNSLRSLFPRMFERLLSVLSSPVSS